jgi:hypothetical protein
MAPPETQASENRRFIRMGSLNRVATQKMLKMKIALDELLKIKGQKKCSG